MSSPIEKEKRFLKLVVARHLLGKEQAQTLWQTAQQEQLSIATLLLDKGLLTQHLVDQLSEDVEKSYGPKRIGGFRILSQLGQGGMGSVYKAVQESVDREVALKVLASHFAQNQQAGERFLREAKTAGKVNHPNVISIIDVGKENGQYYMALELVSGGDAEQLCHREGGRLSEQRALEIIRDASKGLQAIHQVGLVHRDIKPANIFISDEGTAKLADLGLARSEAGEDRMTQTGATVGTPAFMSPEQAEGVHDLDIRSDVYALGATLYALVCGEPPYTGNSAWAVVAKAINDPVPDASLKNNSLSTACIDLINQCMHKDREQRIQDPVTLLREIENVIAGRGLANSTLRATVVTTKAAAQKKMLKKPEAPVRAGKKELESKRSKKTIYLIIAAVFLLFIVGKIMSSKKPGRNGALAAEPAIAAATAETIGSTAVEVTNQAEEVTAPADEDEALAAATEQVYLSDYLERVNRKLEQDAQTTESIFREYTFGIGKFGEETANGHLIRVANQLYGHGIAMHPPADNDQSRATFLLPKRYRFVSGAVGLNDSSGLRNFRGELLFVMYAGGKEIWRSGPITSEQRSEQFRVRLPIIARRITLEVRCGGSFYCAQAVWMDPILEP